MPTDKPHLVQGVRYFPITEGDYAVRPTIWRKLIEDENLPWSFDVSFAVKRAARNKLYSKNSDPKLQPQIGDIVFFDGENSGSRIIAAVSEATSPGIPGTGRFTHVGMVVGINKETGGVLIAEGGGQGDVLHLRQATLVDMETGHVIRPNNKKHAMHAAKIALDISKFDRTHHLANLNKFDSEKAAVDFVTKYPRENSWKWLDYEACFVANYDVPAMAVSQAPGRFYDITEQKTAFSEERYAARHNPGFRKHHSQAANSSYRVFCSRVIKDAVTMGYVEWKYEVKEDSTKLPEGALGKVNTVFGDNLHFLSPKTLYKTLLEAKEEGKNLFTRVGSWVNFDDRNQNRERVVNYRYNGGNPLETGGRPFRNNQFHIVGDEEKLKPEALEEKKLKPMELPLNFIARKNKIIQSTSQFRDLLRTHNSELVNKVELLLQNMQTATDQDELILCLAETRKDHDFYKACAKFEGLVAVTTPGDHLPRINMHSVRDSFFDRMLNWAVLDQKRCANKAKSVNQAVKLQNAFDLLLQIISNKDFWRTRMHNTYKTMPDGVRSMQDALKEFSILARQNKNGIGSIDFTYDQMIEKLKLIATSSSSKESSYRDPDTRVFYDLVKNIDFGIGDFDDLKKFHAKSQQISFPPEEITVEQIKLIVNSAIERYIDLNRNNCFRRAGKQRALAIQVEINSKSLEYKGELLPIINKVLSGDSGGNFDNNSLRKIMAQELSRCLGESVFNDYFVYNETLSNRGSVSEATPSSEPHSGLEGRVIDFSNKL